MDYNTFKNCLKETVKLFCEEGDKVRIDSIIKNNTVKKDCITIQRKNSEITPTIYLEYYYEEFKNGMEIEEIATQIMEADRHGRNNIEFKVEDLLDFDTIKSHIVYKLVNTEANRLILENIPHREYLDFSIIYYCRLENQDGGCATAIIYNNHMKAWGLAEEDLYNIANENTSTILPAVIKSMNELLMELMGEVSFDETDAELLEDEKDSYISMYVLTNEQKIYGACCILYSNIMAEFAKEHGSFYILPSSVHELIFIPENKSVHAKDLCDMVNEVNESQVSADERLSNNVYYYNSSNNLVSIVNKIKFGECIS